MSSSVSSERAFSSAGITISKRRNRLGADIVEALQVLKCLIKRNLIFRESALVDDDGTDDLDDSGGEKQSGEDHDNETGWDSILADEPDNYDPDYEMDFA
jgi:hypothetical protein